MESFQLNKQMERILASIMEGVVALDQRGSVVYCNEHAEAMLWRRNVQPGMNIWAQLPEALGSVFHVKLEEALATGSPISFTARYEPTEQWHEVRCYPFDEGITVFLRDVSAVRLREEQLRKSRDYYLKMFEESPSLIWRADADGLCNYVNQSWLEFTGFDCESALGMGWSTAIHPDDRERFLGLRSVSIHAREPFNHEYRLAYNDGSYRWVVDYGRPFCDLDDEYAGFVGTCYDVSQRKILEEQLLHAQRMESVGTLAGGIAHDFNNILTVIIGCSEMVQNSVQGNQVASRYIGQVLEAANRAAGLTRNLLAFSRKQVVETTVVDLNSVVAGLQKLLTRIIPENISMSFESAPEKLTIMADAGQLEQVLINLVANSRDALPNGGELHIRTRSSSALFEGEDAGGSTEIPCAVLEVEDDGTGMDKGVMERIFDPFYTTKEVGKGTGLGLSMVYGIISQHHGKVEVNSLPGEGATFTIYLPLTAEAAMQKGNATSGVAMKGNETILLAEDDLLVCEANRAILEFAGYRVLTAENGRSAVDRFCENRVDLVISDVIMPIMNGIEASRKINEMRPGTPIIFTSGYAADILEREGGSNPDTRLLMKPVLPETLLRAVREALDAARSHGSRYAS